MRRVYLIPMEPNEESVASVLEMLCQPRWRSFPGQLCFEDERVLALYRHAYYNKQTGRLGHGMQIVYDSMKKQIREERFKKALERLRASGSTRVRDRKRKSHR